MSATAGRPVLVVTQAPSVWARFCAHRLVAAAATGLGVVGTVLGLLGALLHLVPWWWVVAGAAWLGLTVAGAALTGSPQLAAACSVLAAIATFGPVTAVEFGRSEAAESRTTPSSEPAELLPEPSREMPATKIGLGSRVRATVIADGASWTLTHDHRLVGVKLPTGRKFATLPAPPSAVELAVCGSLLVVLSSAGRLHKYDADTGAKRGSYRAGRTDVWECLGTAALLVTDAGFVRVDLLDPPRHAHVKKLSPRRRPVDLAAAGSRLWMLDDNTSQLLGWDATSQNLRYAGRVEEGATRVALLGGLPYVLHADDACLRGIDRRARAERSTGIRVGDDPRTLAWDGDTIAVGAHRGGVVTLVSRTGVVTRRRLTVEDLQIDALAVNAEHIAIGDSRGEQLVIVKRSDVADLPRVGAQACP